MCSDSFDIKNFYVFESQINVIFCMTSLYVFRSTISVRCARRTVLIIHNAAVSVTAKLNSFFSEKQIFFFRFSKRRKIWGVEFYYSSKCYSTSNYLFAIVQYGLIHFIMRTLAVIQSRSSNTSLKYYAFSNSNTDILYTLIHFHHANLIPI